MALSNMSSMAVRTIFFFEMAFLMPAENVVNTLCVSCMQFRKRDGRERERARKTKRDRRIQRKGWIGE